MSSGRSSGCSPSKAGRHTSCSSSTARSCVPVSRRPALKGAAKPGALPLAWRLLTKIHLKTDLYGHPLDFHLTGGEASDTTHFATSLERAIYSAAAQIEQTMGKLKRFKRIALRCDKTAASFEAFTSFACSLLLIKTVHRT